MDEQTQKHSCKRLKRLQENLLSVHPNSLISNHCNILQQQLPNTSCLPHLPLSTKSCGNTRHQCKSRRLQQSQRGAGSPHTQDAFYCHSQCYKTCRPIFCYCISTSSFRPLRFTPWLSQGSGTAEGFTWFKASPDKILPKHERCQGAEQSLPQPPGSGGLGSKPAVTQCSCVNSEQPAGEAALGESTAGGLTGHPSPLLHSSSDPWPLSELCRFVCTWLYQPWLCPHDLDSGVTSDLLITTEVSGGHQALGWSWLTCTGSTLVWLPYDSPPHWQDHCPACFVVMLSFQPAFFLPSNPLCAPWQVQ